MDKGNAIAIDTWHSPGVFMTCCQWQACGRIGQCQVTSSISLIDVSEDIDYCRCTIDYTGCLFLSLTLVFPWEN